MRTTSPLLFLFLLGVPLGLYSQETPSAPVITVQPTNQAVTVGKPATFAVTATGTALSYQWQKNGANIAGATSSSYTTPATTAADSSSTFQVIVTNVAGNVTSNSITLTVNSASTAQAITTQPTNQTVASGLTATFSVIASGAAPLTYQWQKSGVAITGATASSYTTPATTSSDNGSTFAVVVSSSAGTITSNSATLTVYDSKSFELMTGVGAVVAGVDSTSYNINNDTNALAATNIGRKRIELLLGGGFIMPFHLGGDWIENAYPNDTDYKNYRPWETFLSIRFAPGSDQTINGFVVGGGYRITKYFSLLVGYSATPMDEPSPGFRLAASQIVANNPTISPYNRYNATALAQNTPGAFDGFPLFVYNANGVTTQKLFPTSPTITHFRSGVYFGVGIPVNLASLLKPSK